MPRTVQSMQGSSQGEESVFDGNSAVRSTVTDSCVFFRPDLSERSDDDPVFAASDLGHNDLSEAPRSLLITPSSLTFSDVLPGVTQNSVVIIKNLSTKSKKIRVLPPATRVFSIDTACRAEQGISGRSCSVYLPNACVRLQSLRQAFR